MIYNELPTAFPWYDKKEKQQRYRENAAKSCDYRLISPKNALLPFQIKVPYPTGSTAAPTIVAWRIHSSSGTIINVTPNNGLLTIRRYEDGARVFYNGEPMVFQTSPGVTPALNLTPGKYYSEIEFNGGRKFYSEVFCVTENINEYMKIEFWNNCDIAPVAYSTGESQWWKQIVYIDSFIHTSEPEVEEDGERDGNDMLIPTFQRMIVRYRFSAHVPDYMKIALVSMQMHDEVWITTPESVRSGKAERVTTTTTVDDTGAYSVIDVTIDQHVLVKKACCSNMELLD